MQKRRYLTLVAVIMLAVSACSPKETEEVESEIVVDVPPLTTQADSWTAQGLTVYGIGPVCGFQELNNVLEIHPFFNESKHISMKKMIISETGFWNTLCKATSTAVYTKEDNFELLTLDTGVTYGYYQVDNETAYIFESDTLPSSYVKEVMRKTCK